MRYLVVVAMMWGSLSVLSAQTNLYSPIKQIIADLKKSEHGHDPLLPSTASLNEVKVKGDRLEIFLNLPLNWLTNQMDESIHEELMEHFGSQISEFDYYNFSLQAKNKSREFVHLSFFLDEYILTEAQISKNKDDAPNRNGNLTRRGILLDGEAQPRGQLSGKTIWLSAGHGWMYDRKRKTFKTQRHNTHGMVEDFATVESINYHLLKYLYNAGGNSWTVRERDMNPNEVIVDNDHRSSNYTETGHWQTSYTKGYNNKSYRYTISKDRPTATATYRAAVPENGKYWVSVHYVSGANRTIDTRYRIKHAGGESVVCVNQEVHGNTWVYLGQFYFEKNGGGAVTLTNESTEIGQAVIADAVRFGGGVGDVSDCVYGKSSGEPRFEEAAKYYAAYQGFPHCMNDVMVRPLYAEWELSKGTDRERKNAIYLSWHTNASGQSGTESYVHSRKRVRGSKRLRRFIHQELISDLRKGWDANWKDRGEKSADFGELRGLRTMPGVLLEMAFHDHPSDAKAIGTPAFRQMVARSVYKGIVRYFADKDGQRPIFLPEPPTHLSAKNTKNKSVTISWKAPKHGGVYGSRAKEYRVYKSDHGKAFSNGIFTNENSFTFKELLPGKTYYFRVAAVNDGGESFPTSVVAVRLPERGENLKYLIVDGFDRLDQTMSIKQNESKPRFAPLGNTRRLFLEQMNNYDYMVEHAEALAACGIAFDGATNEAVIAGDVGLSKYKGVDWFLGKESSADRTLNSKEQRILKRYLNNGGNLIISGSELAYDLDNKNGGRDFYRNFLRSKYLGDNAKAGGFRDNGGVAFDGLRGNFNNDEYGFYPVNSPDFIQPVNGGKVALNYKSGKTAAVVYKGKYGVVNFAFPLETIKDLELRMSLLSKSLEHLHGSKYQATKTILAKLPSVFDSNLRVDLSNTPEGRAAFRLYDQRGKEVYANAWKHSGFRSKTLENIDLPAAMYEYEIELLGIKQRGFVLKE